jgi:secreted trypsin-like serine protease
VGAWFDFHILAGRVKVKAGGDGSVANLQDLGPIARIFIHKDYDPQSLRNDIALIKMKNPIPFSKSVSPIKLPPADFALDELIDDTNISVSGWGNTKVGFIFKKKVAAKELHSVSGLKILPLWDEDLLAKKENLTMAEFNDEMISMNPERVDLVGYQNGEFLAIRGKKSACQGDSGGPMVYHSKVRQMTFQIGVVSHGSRNEKCDEGFDLYSNVFHYLPWIESQMRN